MQGALSVEKRPNETQKPMKNLRRSSSGKLWLVDDENGLFDAYSLIYTSGSSFHHFHTEMLHTTCVFQHRVAEALKNMHYSPESPLGVLQKYVVSKEPLFSSQNIDSFYRFLSHFEKRLQEVVEWIDECQIKYGSSGRLQKLKKSDWLEWWHDFPHLIYIVIVSKIEFDFKIPSLTNTYKQANRSTILF